MSLKAFHIVFVILSAALSLSFGWITLTDYFACHRTIDLIMGVGALVAGFGLVPYLSWFLSKTKKMGPSTR